MTWSNGGEMLSPDMKRAAFASESAVAGLRVWTDLIDRGHAQIRTGPTEFLQTIQDFVNEKTAMYWGSAADMGAVAAAKFEWRAAAGPGFGGEPLVVSPGGGDAGGIGENAAGGGEGGGGGIPWGGGAAGGARSGR